MSGDAGAHRLLLSLSLALALALIATPRAAADPTDSFTLGNLTNLSESPTQQSIFPEVAQSESSLTGAFHVAWREGKDIEYRRVERIGAEPDPPKTLSEGLPGQNDNVDIATAGHYVYVVWGERRLAEEVWLARSSDEGLSFDDPVQISDSPGVTSWFPKVAAQGNDVWIAWEEREGGPHVAAVHSADGGESFSPAEDLGATAGSADLDVAATESAAHVVFRNDGGDPDARGLFLRSAVRGVPFGPPTQLSDGPRPFALESAFTDVAVAWKEGAGSIKIGSSADLAPRLTIQTIVADCSGDYDCLPQLEVSAGRAILAWVERDGSEHDIMASRAHALREGFGPPEHVADDATGLSAVHIGPDGRALVAWHDAPHRGADLEAYVASRAPQGTTFTTYRVSDSPGDDSFLPQLAVDDRGLAVIWSEYSGVIGATPYNPNLFEVLYQPVTFGPRDLRIVDVQAVQAPRDFSELVAGKQTAVRVAIENRMSIEVSAELDCSLKQGSSAELPCSLGGLDRSIRLDPGLNERYLWAPVAVADPVETRVSVEVDPNDRLAEIDETNNSATKTYPVRETRPLRVLVLGVAAGGEPATSCPDIRKVASLSHEFIAGGFPLAERELIVEEDCVGVVRVPSVLGRQEMSRMLIALDEIKEWQLYDKVIAALPTGWFGAHSSAYPNAIGLSPLDRGQDGLIVEARSDAGVTAAHELTHNYGFTDEGQPHVPPDSPAPGHWPAQGLTFDPGVDWMVSDAGDDQWASRSVYRFLLDELARGTSREAALAAAEASDSLMLAGSFRDDGSLEALPSFRLEGAPDVPLGAPGELELEYVDGAGAVIARTAFDPTPGAVPAGREDLLGPESFSVRVPDVPGTERLRLTRGGRLLLDRRRSPNAPAVTVRSPNGGESLLAGERAEVQWSATDADGDELTSVVLLSTDGGTSWRPLATGVTGERLRFTPTRAEVGDRALVRVVTSDGLNTSEDRSDATFSIETPLRNGRIALVTNHFPDANGSPDPEIATLEPDGSDLRRLTTRAQVDAWPAWSPDGTEIAWVRDVSDPCCDVSIWRMDAVGGNQRRVTSPDPASRDGFPDWSPDGGKIAFVRRTVTPACREDLVIIELGSGVEEVLTSVGGCESIQHPAWSPDGREIAYSHSSDAGIRIRKLRSDGTQTTPDDLGPGYSPDWSPDGDQLVIVDRFRDLVVMERDGSGRHTIATLGDSSSANAYNRVAWSPDGLKIAAGFQTLSPQRADVQVMNTDGSDVQNITEGILLPAGTPGFSGESQPSWQALPPAGGEPPVGPEADAGGPYGAREGGEVELDASASDGHGSALELDWDLDGDGDFDDASGATATTELLNDGTYTVAVRVADERGLTDTARAEITAANRAPAVREVVAQVEGTALERVDAAFTDVGKQDSHTAEVDWGDGGPPQPAEVVLTGDGGRVTATRPRSGPAGRTVTVRVFDDAGDVGEGSTTMAAVPANGPPAVEDVAAETSAEQRVDLEVPAIDPERDLLRATIGVAPAHGEALLLDGPLPVLAGVRVAYSPAPGFAGTDSFQVRISDGLSAPATATVSITVRGEGGGPGVEPPPAGPDPLDLPPSGLIPPDVVSGGCVNATAAVKGKRLGPARLGRARPAQRAILEGAILRTKRKLDRYCVVDGGTLRIGYPTARLTRELSRPLRRKIKGRVVLTLTSSARFSLSEIEPGDRARRARRQLRGEQRFKAGKSTWYVAPGRRSRLLVKAKRGTVREIGIGDRRLTGSLGEAKHFLSAWRIR